VVLFLGPCPHALNNGKSILMLEDTLRRWKLLCKHKETRTSELETGKPYGGSEWKANLG